MADGMEVIMVTLLDRHRKIGGPWIYTIGTDPFKFVKDPGKRHAPGAPRPKTRQPRILDHG